MGYALSDIDQFYQHKTEQTVENFETILGNLRTLGWVMYDEPDIKTWFLTKQPGTEADALGTQSAFLRMRRMISAESLISRAYLVNPNQKRLLDTQNGLMSFNKFPDKDLLDIINDKPPFLTMIGHEYDGVSYFILIFSSTPTAAENGSCLVLSIDKQQLQKFLFQQDSDSQMNAAVIDGEGSQLLGMVNDDVIAGLTSEQSRTKNNSFTINRGSCIINAARMRTQPWIVCFVTPVAQLMGKANAIRNNILATAGVLLLIQIVFIFWNSIRTYRPFNELAEKIRGSYGLPEGTSQPDHMVIEAGISSLENSLQKMEGVARQHNEFMKSEALRTWINNGSLSPMDRGYINNGSRLLSHELLIVIVIRFVTYSDDLDSATELLKNIGDILAEYMSGSMAPCEIVDMADSHMVALAGCDDAPRREELIGILDNTGEMVYKRGGIKLIIAVSDCVSQGTNLNTVYKHVYEMTMLKFLWGHDKIYTEEDYQEYISQIKPLTEVNALQQLIEAVKLGHEDDILHNLEKLSETLLSLPYNECKFQLTSSIYLLLKTFNKPDPPHTPV